MDNFKIEEAIKTILIAIGEDPTREGLLETPRRVAEMYKNISLSYQEDPKTHLQEIFQDEDHEELVLIKDIGFYSFCEHHLMPFWGKAHLGYIPRKGRLVGLSKLARVVDCLSRRLQIQERLTSQIADTLYKTLDPRGVIVVLEAEHMCMSMRGIQKPGSITITSALRGSFLKNPETRAEAMSLIMSSNK